MGSNQGAYSEAELSAIAGWLRDGLSASLIAAHLSDQRRVHVSRNAIIGIVHRNAALSSIGFSRAQGEVGADVPRAVKAPAPPRPARQKLNAGNIRAKLKGRAFDPGYAPPAPRPLPDLVAPGVYDAASRRLPQIDLQPNDCRFAVNDARPGELHLFCGQPRAGVRPYCDHHCRRAGAGYLAAQTSTVRNAGRAA